MKRYVMLCVTILVLHSNVFAQQGYSRKKRDGAKRNMSYNTQKSGRKVDAIERSKNSGQAVRENVTRFGQVSKTSDPSRFEGIKVDANIALNEINFWARQMSEHALFNHLGLEESDLKQEALKIHKSLEAFREKLNKDSLDLKHMNEILPLLQQEREFQVKIIKMLEEGKWVGWLFPTFENHITLELDYFVDKLNGKKYSPMDEVKFWNKINSDHAGMTAHLLDPSEKEAVSKANALSDNFYNMPKNEKEMMIKLSLKATKELDAFNKKSKAKGKAVKSIIHPVLLDHVIREGEYTIQKLNSLGLCKESAQVKRDHNKQVRQYQRARY